MALREAGNASLRRLRRSGAAHKCALESAHVHSVMSLIRFDTAAWSLLEDGALRTERSWSDFECQLPKIGCSSIASSQRGRFSRASELSDRGRYRRSDAMTLLTPNAVIQVLWVLFYFHVKFAKRLAVLDRSPRRTLSSCVLHLISCVTCYQGQRAAQTA